jgi:hypothetical protein
VILVLRVFAAKISGTLVFRVLAIRTSGEREIRFLTRKGPNPQRF